MYPSATSDRHKTLRSMQNSSQKVHRDVKMAPFSGVSKSSGYPLFGTIFEQANGQYCSWTSFETVSNRGPSNTILKGIAHEIRRKSSIFEDFESLELAGVPFLNISTQIRTEGASLTVQNMVP